MIRYRKQRLDPVSEALSNKAFIRFLFVEVVLLASWIEQEFGWEALSRSGAVVTILALFVLQIQLRNFQNLQKWEDVSNDMSYLNFSKRGGQLWAVDQRTPSTEFTWPDMEKDHKGTYTVVRENEILYRKALARLTSAQIELAIWGTALWGFGDLAPWL